MSFYSFTPIRVMNVMTDPCFAADPSVVAAHHESHHLAKSTAGRATKALSDAAAREEPLAAALKRL